MDEMICKSLITDLEEKSSISHNRNRDYFITAAINTNGERHLS